METNMTVFRSPKAEQKSRKRLKEKSSNVEQ